MDFPQIDWDRSCMKELSKVVGKIKNPFMGKNAFSIKKEDMQGMLQPLMVNHAHSCEGIDLPVLLSKGDHAPTIIIVGESPRRDVRRFKKGLYIGTPFAVAGKQHVPPQCDIYKYIFCRLLDAGYNVYITDAVKIWYNGMQKKDFIKNIDPCILESEITAINPALVVTWGETAQIACKNISVKKLYQTHPVNLNWDRWKVRMLTEAILEGNQIGNDYVIDGRENKVKSPIYLAQFIAQEILNTAPNTTTIKTSRYIRNR